MRLRTIAEALSAPLQGDDSIEVERLAHPAEAGPRDLAIAIAADALAALPGSAAAAAVVAAGASVPERLRAAIFAAPGRDTLAALTSLFDPGPARGEGIHPTAVIAADATVDPSASIGAFVVIGARSRIGPGSTILPHVSIGTDVRIGREALIHSGVRIGDRVEMGDRVIVQPNAVIGADGFSFVPVRGRDGKLLAHPTPLRIHSVGRVIIGDDVEIGACTTIDRATVQSTRIGKGTKIDNLVQIGHNVTIGECCLIAGMAGIAGSCTIGDRVTIAGGVGIGDHITVGSDAIIAAGSGVGTNVPAGMVYSGYPAQRHDRSVENILYLGRQKALHRKVDGLKSRVEALENAGKPAQEG